MTRTVFIRAGGLLLCLVLLFGVLEAQAFRVGVIVDEASLERTQGLFDRMQAEIQKTVGAARKVEFDPSRIRGTDYDMARAKAAYQELEGQSDLILLLGASSAQAALQLPEFKVPTLAIGILDPALQGIPYTADGSSGRKNFSYVLALEDFEEDMMAFQRIVPFKKMALIYSGKSREGFTNSEVNATVRQMETEKGIEIELVALEDNNIVGSLAAMSEDMEAAFLALPYELDREEAKILAEELIERGMPSFSINQTYVQEGILASNSDGKALDQLLRKLAIMVDDAIQQQPLEDMKVSLNLDKELYLNMITARRIGYSPPFELIFTANLIGNSSVLADSTYSLMGIIQKGLQENLNIQISQSDIALSEMDVRTAISQFLPDADYSATAVAINKGASNAFLMRSQYSLSGTGSLSQLIYSEQALANVRIQKLLKQAQEFTTEQQILDVTLDIIKGYLNILNAKANVEIQNENLENSKTNLKLAKVRVKLGASSNTDVYRWQGEVASGKQRLVEAQTGMLTAKAQLNALLNGRLGQDFEVEDVLIDGALFQVFANSQLASYVQGPYELRLITEFLTRESQINYPTRKQLNANMNVLERQRTMNRRLYYTPTIAASASLDNTFWRGGEGSEPTQGMEFVNSSWNAGLNVSIPLFDGNRRKINLETTRIQQIQLGQQIDNLDQNLAFSVRANTLSLLSATTNIGFSKESADNTAENYKLVQNLYQKGQVNIIQLLDAQTAALNAKLAYALSIYEYIQAFLQLENSVGSYSLLASPDDNAAFLDRWQQFLDDKDQENR